MEEFSVFAETILNFKYAHTKSNGARETWPEVVDRVVRNVVKPYFPSLVEDIRHVILERKFIPGGRYLYATGRRNHQIANCISMDVEDSREGWADLLGNITNALMTGAGIGIVYSKLRPKGSLIKGLGGTSTGPLALMKIANEVGRNIIQGGSRRSALWAGLNWAHGDIKEFIDIKNWPKEVREMKGRDFNFPATLDMTNISVMLDDDFFAAYNNPAHEKHSLAQEVYKKVIKRMCKTSEPGFTVDIGINKDNILKNGCSEFCSSDDSDSCNLGSINLSRIESPGEMKAVTELATAFLMCGSLYTTSPYPKVAEVRAKNQRIGLGLLGVHDWLLSHGYRYGECEELSELLRIYQSISDSTAKEYAAKLNINEPKGRRAIAPTGTLSILAETTSGIEPIFCTAFKRRYLKGNDWYSQYVIDSAAERLIKKGVEPDKIEDAMSLAEDPERRIAFQAYIQGYVDMCISSTVNLPPWGSEFNSENTLKNFGEILMKYLPSLRGITTYPDGSRAGQPLNRILYEEAISKTGVEVLENGNSEAACAGGVCGL